MKTKDCPLCGAKDAIIYNEGKQVTHVHPAPKDTIGNYSMDWEGVGYDFSHAEVCPKLTGVIDKKGLLRYHIGYVEIWHSDQNSLEDYNEYLRPDDLEIAPRISRNEGKWIYKVCIKEHSTTRSQLFTAGKDLDDAFLKLKHRLLCGEIISFYRFNIVRQYQFLTSNGKLVFSKLTL